jgi:hypothetical protein
MKTLIAALGAFAMLATGTLATATPAAADGYYRDYGRHGGYRDRGRYNDYRRHHHRGGDDALAAGVIGLGVGALLGGAIASDNRRSYDINEGPVYREAPRYRAAPVYRGGNSHVEACYARYRSYDARSDTFVGYDGNAYRCNL